MELDNLIERYNDALRLQERATISVLNRALDQSFASILPRVEAAIRKGSSSGTAYEIAVATELRKLVPAVTPGQVDSYERTFQRLLKEAGKLGSAYGTDLLKAAGVTPGPGGASVAFVLPIEAATAAARESRHYLARHGQTFAETGAEIVARGVLEGRSTPVIARQLRERLGVVRNHAAVIAETESMRAYGQARDARFKAAGVAWVRWWATVDDRTCPICRPRAGQLYPRGEGLTPLHPRCRCTTTPWNRDVAQLRPEYVEAVENHRRMVMEADPAAVLNRGILV